MGRFDSSTGSYVDGLVSHDGSNITSHTGFWNSKFVDSSGHHNVAMGGSGLDLWQFTHVSELSGQRDSDEAGGRHDRAASRHTPCPFLNNEYASEGQLLS